LDKLREKRAQQIKEKEKNLEEIYGKREDNQKIDHHIEIFKKRIEDEKAEYEV
jgi:hypothetical protein